MLTSRSLRFVNADVIARELGLDAYATGHVADGLRRELLRQRESFVFETVLSDPVGDDLNFLKEAAAAASTVVLCFIDISGREVSEERVAMRVTHGDTMYRAKSSSLLAADLGQPQGRSP